MRFNVEVIAQQVADRIVGKLDATPHVFRNKDFDSVPDCVEAVSAELDFLLQMDLDINEYRKLVSDVLDQKCVEMAFGYAANVIEQYNNELLQQEAEMRHENEQYVRDVL
jgi:hypothetical protein